MATPAAASSSSSEKSKVLTTAPLDNADAKWVALVEYASNLPTNLTFDALLIVGRTTYTDPEGVERTWESAERLTRPTGCNIDGVGVAAILHDPAKPNDEPRILLQKQYRPPINQTVIEVPAGLMDPNETPEMCAIRELKEETGYMGELVKDKSFDISPVMFNDPGFCNTNLQMIHVTVDLSLPNNQNPTPQLEDNEFIETFSVPLKDLWDVCKKLEQEGYAIDARVGSLAEGIEFAKRWKLM